MAKLKSLKRSERKREREGDRGGGADSAASCRVAMVHCFNDGGTVMRHS